MAEATGEVNVGAASPVDGWIDPETRAAFERFQAQVPEGGIMGPVTEAARHRAYRNAAEQQAHIRAWNRQQNPSRARRIQDATWPDDPHGYIKLAQRLRIGITLALAALVGWLTR